MYTLFTIGGNPSVSESANPPKTVPKADRVQNNISESVEKNTLQEKYLLRLDNDKICAYMISDDGSYTLWNSTKMPPTLSESDKKALRAGITTDSFEKLCLYFESYAS